MVARLMKIGCRKIMMDVGYTPLVWLDEGGKPCLVPLLLLVTLAVITAPT
jgi:hypothetical protein